MHDGGQVRILERGAKVGKVQRVAGVQVGVLVAAHLVFDAPGERAHAFSGDLGLIGSD